MTYSTAIIITGTNGKYNSYFAHFVFQSMPVAIFFGSFSSVLYYLGIIQVVISVTGRIIQFFLETGPVESFVAAANIFLGPVSLAMSPS